MITTTRAREIQKVAYTQVTAHTTDGAVRDATTYSELQEIEWVAKDRRTSLIGAVDYLAQPTSHQ